MCTAENCGTSGTGGIRKGNSTATATAPPLVYLLPPVVGLRPYGPPQRGGQLRALWFERGKQYTECVKTYGPAVHSMCMATIRAYEVEAFANRGELWKVSRSGKIEAYVWCPSGREPEFNSGDFGTGEKLIEHAEQHDDVIRWEAELSGDGHETKAHCWAALHEDQHSPREYDNELRSSRVSYTDDPKVPVSIATQGKARIAAYLYAHDVGKGAISSYLDVSERTIRQYVSDVKRGER